MIGGMSARSKCMTDVPMDLRARRALWAQTTSATTMQPRITVSTQLSLRGFM